MTIPVLVLVTDTFVHARLAALAQRKTDARRREDAGSLTATDSFKSARATRVGEDGGYLAVEPTPSFRRSNRLDASDLRRGSHSDNVGLGPALVWTRFETVELVAVLLWALLRCFTIVIIQRLLNNVEVAPLVSVPEVFDPVLGTTLPLDEGPRFTLYTEEIVRYRGYWNVGIILISCLVGCTMGVRVIMLARRVISLTQRMAGSSYNRGAIAAGEHRPDGRNSPTVLVAHSDPSPAVSTSIGRSQSGTTGVTLATVPTTVGKGKAGAGSGATSDAYAESVAAFSPNPPKCRLRASSGFSRYLRRREQLQSDFGRAVLQSSLLHADQGYAVFYLFLLLSCLLSMCGWALAGVTESNLIWIEQMLMGARMQRTPEDLQIWAISSTLQQAQGVWCLIPLRLVSYQAGEPPYDPDTGLGGPGWGWAIEWSSDRSITSGSLLINNWKTSDTFPHPPLDNYGGAWAPNYPSVGTGAERSTIEKRKPVVPPPGIDGVTSSFVRRDGLFPTSRVDLAPPAMVVNNFVQYDEDVIAVDRGALISLAYNNAACIIETIEFSSLTAVIFIMVPSFGIIILVLFAARSTAIELAGLLGGLVNLGNLLSRQGIFSDDHLDRVFDRKEIVSLASGGDSDLSSSSWHVDLAKSLSLSGPRLPPFEAIRRVLLSLQLLLSIAKRGQALGGPGGQPGRSGLQMQYGMEEGKLSDAVTENPIELPFAARFPPWATKARAKVAAGGGWASVVVAAPEMYSEMDPSRLFSPMQGVVQHGWPGMDPVPPGRVAGDSAMPGDGRGSPSSRERGNRERVQNRPEQKDRDDAVAEHLTNRASQGSVMFDLPRHPDWNLGAFALDASKLHVDELEDLVVGLFAWAGLLTRETGDKDDGRDNGRDDRDRSQPGNRSRCGSATGGGTPTRNSPHLAAHQKTRRMRFRADSCDGPEWDEPRVPQTVHVSEAVLRTFFHEVAFRSAESAPGPYHTLSKAVDATHTVLALVAQSPSLQRSLTSLDVFALLIAAFSGRMTHRGLSNDFLVKSGDLLALTYNDQSPQENFDASSFSLVCNTWREANVFEALSGKDAAFARCLVLRLVVQLDPIRHNATVAGLVSALEISLAKRRAKQMTDAMSGGKGPVGHGVTTPAAPALPDQDKSTYADLVLRELRGARPDPEADRPGALDRAPGVLPPPEQLPLHLRRPAPPLPDVVPTIDRSDVTHVLAGLLHLADNAMAIKPLALHCEWSLLRFSEWALEHDQRRQRGLVDVPPTHLSTMPPRPDATKSADDSVSGASVAAAWDGVPDFQAAEHLGKSGLMPRDFNSAFLPLSQSLWLARRVRPLVLALVAVAPEWASLAWQIEHNHAFWTAVEAEQTSHPPTTRERTSQNVLMKGSETQADTHGRDKEAVPCVEPWPPALPTARDMLAASMRGLGWLKPERLGRDHPEDEFGNPTELGGSNTHAARSDSVSRESPDWMLLRLRHLGAGRPPEGLSNPAVRAARFSDWSLQGGID